MDKQEKFHQDKPMQDAQAQVISDNELDTVSGGRIGSNGRYCSYCQICEMWVYSEDFKKHNSHCPYKLS